MTDERTTRGYAKRFYGEADDRTLERSFRDIQIILERLSQKRLINPDDQGVRKLHSQAMMICSIIWSEIQIREQAGTDYVLNYEEVA